MVIVVRNMTNTPLTGNAHFDAKIIENSNGWIFGQGLREEWAPSRRKRSLWHLDRLKDMIMMALTPNESEPRPRRIARAGACLSLLGLGWLAVLLGLTVPWFVFIPLAVTLAGEVLIVASLIPIVRREGEP